MAQFIEQNRLLRVQIADGPEAGTPVGRHGFQFSSIRHSGTAHGPASPKWGCRFGPPSCSDPATGTKKAFTHNRQSVERNEADHPVEYLPVLMRNPCRVSVPGLILQKAVRVSGTISTQFCGAFQDPLAQGIHHVVEIVGEFRGVEPGRAVMPGAFKHRGAGIEVGCQIADAAGFSFSIRLLCPPMAADFLREDGVDIHLHALFPLVFTRWCWGLRLLRLRGGFSPSAMASSIAS